MTEDLTVKQLRFAQWYLAHKKNLRRSFVGFLIVVNVFLWGLNLYQFIFYVQTAEAHELMLKELTTDRIDFVSLHKHFAPYDLIITSYNVIHNKKFDYDFIASIENPNKKWRVANIEYYFSWDGGRTESKKTFILPDQKRYIFILGQEISKRPGNTEIIFSNIDWKRVRPGELQTLGILSKLKVWDTRLSFVVPEQKMVSIPKVSFKIKNQSIYSFWQVNFIVVLYQRNQISGINVSTVKQLLASEEREIEFMWPDIPQSTEIEIRPELNVFNSSVFMPAS